jgi:hypothetical protein
MTRNLKALMAAAMALAALGAIGVTGASAAGEQFHCEFAPCRIRVTQDGTGKTGHQVFIFENQAGTISASTTCETIGGHATAPEKTGKELTITNIVYGGCTINGSPEVIIDMNGCDYLLTSERNAASRGIIHVSCPTGKKIEETFRDPTTHALKCTIDIAAQTLEGVNYHNIGVWLTTELTIEMNITGIVAEATGASDAECAGLRRNVALKGRIPTANWLLTGEEDKETGASMVGFWWA